MALFLRHTFSVFAILGYLLGNTLVDLAHHDHANLPLHSEPVLSSHDCGAREIHVPIDQARSCLACSQFAQRFSADVSRSFTFDAAVVSLAVFPSHTGQIIETDVVYSGKRGPPFA